MPIKFHCPNAACGKALTVSDQAAGRTGKCPSCGGVLVVPQQASISAEPIPEPDLGLMPEPVSAPAQKPFTARAVDDADWGEGDPAAVAGSVVSFEALGLAWGLFKQQLGTWILAVLVVGVVQFGCQMLLGFLSMLASVAQSMVIGSHLPISSLLVLALATMIHGVLVGGLFKMALKQIDGGEIRVGDLFDVGPVAPALALAGLMTELGTALGFMFLIIPGLIYAGLVMFTAPAVVEGRGAVEALKLSAGTLKRQWASAALFAFVMSIIAVAGVLLCGFGVLFTLPLYVLAMAEQYRRTFAVGCVGRKAAVADPWAEAVGKPSAATGSGRVPGWAWGLLGACILLPVAMVALVATLVVPAAWRFAERAQERQQMGDGRVLMKNARGALPGGITVPNNAPLATTPDDFVQQALDSATNGGEGRRVGLRLLSGLPTNERQRSAVVSAVTPMLGDSEAAVDAARVLERWAGSADAPTLIAALDHEQAPVRASLIRALGRLKAREAIPVLVTHLAIPEDRGEASRALRAIGPEAAPEIRKIVTTADADTRREVASLLRQMGSNDRGTDLSLTLAALKSPNNTERDLALQKLAGTPVVEASRGEVLAAVVPLVKALEASIRRWALKVVDVWGTDEQVPVLADALDDTDRNLQVMAVTALAKRSDPGAALALAKVLGVPELRRRVTDALIALKPTDDQIEAEVRNALESPDANTRQAACQVLKEIGTDASVPALKKLLGDQRRNVANAAAAALTAIDPSIKLQTPSMPAKAKKGAVRKK